MKSKKRVLLVGPYRPDELRIGQYLSPPLGVYRIASYLSGKGIADVDVVDCNIDGKGRFVELLEDNDYSIIGFSLLYQTLKDDVALMNIARAKSGALLVAGGQGAAFCADLLLMHSPVDVIVKGLGEFAMDMILQIFDDRKQIEALKRVPGLLVRSGDGFVDTGLSPQYTDEQFRDISLSLDFSRIPYERYWAFMEKIYTKEHLKIMKNDGMLRTIRLMTSSHCPMGCKFCSATNFLNAAVGCQRPLFLEPPDIMTMLIRAKAAHPGVESIYFCDDDFLIDRSRVAELCRLIEGSGMFADNSFFCLSRVDCIDTILLKALKQAGFKFIIYGVESFSRRLLADMSKIVCKDEPADIIKETVEMTISAGLTPLMNLILFYPTATVDDTIKTIEHSLELVEKGARLSVYTYTEVYPGASILSDSSFELAMVDVDISGKKVSMPSLILPKNPVMRVLAEESVKLSLVMREAVLARHCWKGVVPHPLNGLSVFMALYSLLGRDCSRLEMLADRMMGEAVVERSYCRKVIEGKMPIECK